MNGTEDLTDAARETELLQLLRPHGQEHLLAFWSELDESQRERFEYDLRRVSWQELGNLFRQATTETECPWSRLAAQSQPPPAVRLDDRKMEHRRLPAVQTGEKALRDGDVGVVLVAGGQGTRLGFRHPKGMYPVGPVSQHSLFQILLEKVVALRQRYGQAIPLYLMTSPATHEETLAYLSEHAFFGLPPEDVIVFCQGTMPAADAESGHALLARKGSLFQSPDGHGGMLPALEKQAHLQDMRRRGLRQLFYMQVDNPLVRVCEPEFLGYHILAGSEMSTQVVAKQDPAERVGNVVSIAGKIQIIEYSDLPADIAARTQPDGSLELWAGSIAVHAFSLEFLERMAAHPEGFPFHVARKKVPYVNTAGERVEPKSPNAFKFERFIFDLLPHAENAIVVEVDATTNFAPLKNASGEPRDTPEMARKAMIALYRSWLRAAGAKVHEDAVVEISPCFALDAEEVARKIEPGTRIDCGSFLA